ncbi:NitT/TauT family transport system ATP-binding protein [Pseudobutyrivibrio sp. UC1225]|uniref:ATP-binding cassette domain-containing protein n=1 Tax=Pseudobutyrivibrio sp. UC1225 TaxID=1798185 RepID=UPI0008E4C8A1|nr:ATP-binding cassette domain-containing protein [Pseudobutyrivibrio sp. UC1225]SFO25706.1 NitT/TauT family transport system ATP-binding protein [Pseudobutyrivibrio sp. UC1225]
MDIVIENLSKAYDNQLVLDNLSVTFPEKSFTCLMGKSGAGKTTLLSILMELETADSGVITGLEDKKISVVFQENRLCNNLTALLNIKMVIEDSSRISDSDIMNWLEKIGLGEDAKKPVQEYSGGMKRRVAILRALLADFDLLIMDEPLKGLDEATKQQVIDLIKELTKEKTVIMTTHDISEAKAFDATIVFL